ncbi:MAG: methyltransferase domain-containing protein [Bacteroidales bacterium]
MNKELVKRKFGRVVSSYGQAAVMQQLIAKRLFGMLHGDCYNRVLEIGCGSGFLTKLWSENIAFTSATINDINESWQQGIAAIMAEKMESWDFIAEDAEDTEFGEEFDLILSSNTIQWFNNPATFIKRMYDKLATGGVLLISSFGVDNFKEIREVSGSGLRYYSSGELVSKLPMGCVTDMATECVEMDFESVNDLLKHLKSTGVNAVDATIKSRGELQRFIEEYTTKFSCETGKVRLTYNPLYLKIIKI